MRTRAAAAAALLIVAGAARAAVPTPDHVVIVIEENHSAASILGNPDAPYLNGLAGSGQSFSNFFAISHPSQPNYIQFFSGASQNVYDNDLPAGYPFNTPNLGDAVRDAGGSFIGYSEGLPAAGSDVVSSGDYVRRHNPWVNWQNDVSRLSNQLPTNTNQPFSAFPTNAAGYATMPKVSIVVPNLQNDMHDGTIAQADAWLQSHIEPYRAWAATHNSLLIVTWDEDEGAQNNQIPTFFSGPMVRTGATAAAANHWNLHNLLRTVGDMYGAAPAGSASRVAPITGVWTGETTPTTVTKSFRHGASGYSGGKDTYIESGTPSTGHATATLSVVDGSPTSQGLIRFDNLIGAAADQIAPGAQILRAKLTITTGGAAGNESDATMALHKMLADWTDGSTWESLVGGVSVDGSEALAIADGALTPTGLGMTVTFDVTTTLQEWANGAANRGWVITPSGTDGWRFNTNEATLNLRPLLEVTLVPEPTALGAVAISSLVALTRRRRPRD